VYHVTYRIVDTPDWIESQALNSASGSIDRVELDAEDQSHASVVSLDVYAAAHSAKGACGNAHCLSDFVEVGLGEREAYKLGVWLDGNRHVDLAIELIELSCVLRLGQRKLIAGDPVDAEAVLGEDVLGFSSFAQVVVAEVNATSVQGDTAVEALVLGGVSAC
jgi:hypothetical protein